MTSKIAGDRITEALNKISSNDYNNIESWKMEDAVNKSQNDWFRRQVHGFNSFKEGKEQTTMRVDDLQTFLIKKDLSGIDRGIFIETVKIPDGYRYYNRLSVKASKGNCNNISIKSTFVEDANVDEYLLDYHTQPSFDFEQTFHTMGKNRFYVYHNKDFKITSITLSYFREPSHISFDKKDIDIVWEWKDDVAEIIIDEAIKNLAGNIEHFSANQLAEKRVEENN